MVLVDYIIPNESHMSTKYILSSSESKISLALGVALNYFIS